MESLFFILGWLFGKNSCKEEKKSNFIKIDDKNFIINGKWESLETDTLLLRFKQEQEDRRHYQAYERATLKHDRETIRNDYFKTREAINKYPDLKDGITSEKLETITEKYEQYTKKCNKLDETFILTKEEFLIKETHPALCIDWSNFKLFLQQPLGCYIIHNEKTAKYKGGNLREKIMQEFKEKWY